MQAVQTLLQSGNVVFDSDGHTPAELERQIEKPQPRGSNSRRMCSSVEKEWKAIIANNPFPKEAKQDPGHLLMVALKGAPLPAQVTALEDAITGREVVSVHGRSVHRLSGRHRSLQSHDRADREEARHARHRGTGTRC